MRNRNLNSPLFFCEQEEVYIGIVITDFIVNNHNDKTFTVSREPIEQIASRVGSKADKTALTLPDLQTAQDWLAIWLLVQKQKDAGLKSVTFKPLKSLRLN